jgi:hypothetical protein
MLRKLSVALLLVLTAALTASAQSSNDPIQALKDTLSNGQSSGQLIQDVLGGENSDRKKTDKKLENPQTIRQQPSSKFILEKDIKTTDERILRQADQDPELRADDTVTIEMIPVEVMCKRKGYSTSMLDHNGETASALNANGIGAGGLNALEAAGAMAGATDTKDPSDVGLQSGLNKPVPKYQFDYSRCPLPSRNAKERTDDEKDEAKKFQQGILNSNPYKLNHYGVLELAGLRSIPLAGLTAYEADQRLNTDPELSEWFVKLTLLRLVQTGPDALKPFGYDLFEGVPSTFAPVSDIQVPVGYLVGPGDTLHIQLYGNQPEQYELTVQRDGRINFPKLGPVMVSGMTFDAAREAIEARVATQLV